MWVLSTRGEGGGKALVARPLKKYLFCGFPYNWWPLETICKASVAAWRNTQTIEKGITQAAMYAKANLLQCGRPIKTAYYHQTILKWGSRLLMALRNDL